MTKWLFSAACTAAMLWAEPAPLLIFVPGASGQVPRAAGWEVVSVRATPDDAGMAAIEGAVQGARRQREIDPLRTYIAGESEGAGAVFFAASRRPDLFAAALAFGGDPKAAIDTGQLFGGNTALVPLLWVASTGDRPLLERSRAKLAAAGFNLEPQPEGLTAEQAFAWLAKHTRDAFPEKVDCETGSPAFARCYWVDVTKFDPAQRNDVLPSTRVMPGSGARLDIGAFGFRTDAPGPGLTVEWLPDNYKGPLKVNDRIVSIAGKEIKDGRAYVEMMDEATQERRVGVILQRGKERIRIETRIVLPDRRTAFTARVQAQFLRDMKEVLVISRGAGEMRITLPDYWTPATLNWNGNELGKADAAGCWVLAAGAQARRCP